MSAWSASPARGAGCQGEGLSRAERLPAEEAPGVRKVRALPSVDGKGAHVQRVFPSPSLANLDPFVLLDDFDVHMGAGFPTHPHRGFEAFTYMVEGEFHHADNLGNDSVIGVGGTQRFTSGRGAWHSEMPETSGSNRGLQLWVNLPRRLKQMPPNYAGLAPEAHPTRLVDGAGVRTVVGNGSQVELQTSVRYEDVTLPADHAFHAVVEDGWNALVYVIEGAVRIAGTVVERHEAALPVPGPLAVLAVGAARFAFLAGKPHHEPIIHHGPFVD